MAAPKSKSNSEHSFMFDPTIFLTDTRFLNIDVQAIGIITKGLAVLSKNEDGLPTNSDELCRILAIDEQLLNNHLAIVEQIFYIHENRYFCILIDDFFARKNARSETYRANAKKSVEARANRRSEQNKPINNNVVKSKSNNCSTVAEQLPYAGAHDVCLNNNSNISSLNTHSLNIYNEYPKKVGRAAALKSIDKSLLKLKQSKDDPVAWLTERVKLYTVKTKNVKTRFIPHASTWFNEERFFDDESTWGDNSKVSDKKKRSDSSLPSPEEYDNQEEDI